MLPNGFPADGVARVSAWLGGSAINIDGHGHALTNIYSQIVKERQMEFDTETEPETFYELFGDDTRFLGE